MGGPDSPSNKSYVEEMKYRWAVICLPCYRILDTDLDTAGIGAKSFNLAGASRDNKAAFIDESKYREFQKAEAAKLALEI